MFHVRVRVRVCFEIFMKFILSMFANFMNELTYGINRQVLVSFLPRRVYIKSCKYSLLI